jgi:hypothetical protein
MNDMSHTHTFLNVIFNLTYGNWILFVILIINFN